MVHCDKCGVLVRSRSKTCPLCQNILSQEGTEEIYPVIPTVLSANSLFFKILLFVFICVAVLCVTANFFLFTANLWSLYVVAALTCIWALMYVAVKVRYSMLKNVIYESALISLICVLFDVFIIKNGFSITYALPTVWICAMISIAILNKVMELQVFEQLIYVVMLIIFGLILLIFVLTGIVTNVYPSLVCVVGSVISLAALLIFKGNTLKAEMKRRFHI